MSRIEKEIKKMEKGDATKQRRNRR